MVGDLEPFLSRPDGTYQARSPLSQPKLTVVILSWSRKGVNFLHLHVRDQAIHLWARARIVVTKPFAFVLFPGTAAL
jgi:hypothetical protein